jgi:hypothetical protein
LIRYQEKTSRIRHTVLFYFQNIDPPYPTKPGKYGNKSLWYGGITHSMGGEWVGGYYLKDKRHCYVGTCQCGGSLIQGQNGTGSRNPVPQHCCTVLMYLCILRSVADPWHFVVDSRKRILGCMPLTNRSGSGSGFWIRIMLISS